MIDIGFREVIDLINEKTINHKYIFLYCKSVIESLYDKELITLEEKNNCINELARLNKIEIYLISTRIP